MNESQQLCTEWATLISHWNPDVGSKLGQGIDRRYVDQKCDGRVFLAEACARLNGAWPIGL